MSPTSTESDWQQCEAGTLAQLNRVHKTKQSQRKMAAVGGVAALAVIIAVCATPLVYPPPSGPNPNQVAISCETVIEQQDQFFAGELSLDERENVLAHLEMCLYCRNIYKSRAQELGVELADYRNGLYMTEQLALR